MSPEATGTLLFISSVAGTCGWVYYRVVRCRQIYGWVDYSAYALAGFMLPFVEMGFLFGAGRHTCKLGVLLTQFYCQ